MQGEQIYWMQIFQAYADENICSVFGHTDQFKDGSEKCDTRRFL